MPAVLDHHCTMNTRSALVVFTLLAGAPVAQPQGAAEDRQADLKKQALEDAGVQAMLDVFAAEIREAEER